MEYNSNTYLTIAHTDCEALGLGEGHRTNNTGDICISWNIQLQMLYLQR
jgi:hypothetical protein